MTERAIIKVLRRNLRQCLQRRQLDEAWALLQQLQGEEPLAVETRGFEVELLMAAERWQDARTLLGQLLPLFPESARIHYLAGRVDYHDKDYRRARGHFTESDRIHSHWLAQRWLGKVLTQLGEHARAEALLVDLAASHPAVKIDLAWLYERSNQIDAALKCLQEYLAIRPDDSFALDQQRRLRARLQTPAALVEEMDALRELGEPMPAALLPAYVQGLLETSRGAAAREFVAAQVSTWDERTAASVAWACHQRQAYDMALQLFLRALPAHTHDYKFLGALESAARHCRRESDVVHAYQAHAAQHPQLFGRLKSLRKRVADDERQR